MRISLMAIPVVLLLAQPALASSRMPSADRAVPAASVDAADFEDITGEERSKQIAQIEGYISGIPSIIANFTQTSSDGSTGSGKFFMKRPGKVRWQYDPPTPLLLVSNGKSLTYYDPGLDQVTYVDVDDTLASFIAQKQIKLDGPSTKLTALTRGGDRIRVTLVQRKKPSEGSMTLEMDKETLEIKRMITIDATGNETQLTLLNPQYGPVLDDKLFVFVDPRGVNDRRNRIKNK